MTSTSENHWSCALLPDLVILLQSATSLSTITGASSIGHHKFIWAIHSRLTCSRQLRTYYCSNLNLICLMRNPQVTYIEVSFPWIQIFTQIAHWVWNDAANLKRNSILTSVLLCKQNRAVTYRSPQQKCLRYWHWYGLLKEP